MKNIEPTVFESAEGYTCAVTFNNRSGTRCGYIFVPATDKAYVSEHKFNTYSFSGKEIDERTIDVTYSEYDIEVHGGLTYGHDNKASKPSEYPIIIKQDGIWIGFDANHYNDSPDYDVWETLLEDEGDHKMFEILSSTSRDLFGGGMTTVRTEEFMIRELESVSSQIYIMTNGVIEGQDDD